MKARNLAVAMVIVLLLGVGASSGFANTYETYEVEVKEGKVLKMVREKSESSTFFNILVPKNFPADIDKKKAIKSLAVNDNTEYVYEKKGEITNIFPWKYRLSKTYVVTKIKSGSLINLEAWTEGYLLTEKSTEENEAKRKFFICFFTMLAALCLSVIGGTLVQMDKKIGLVFIMVAVVSAVSVSVSVSVSASASALVLVLASASASASVLVLASVSALALVSVLVSALALALALALVSVLVSVSALALALGAVSIAEAVFLKIILIYFIVLFIELLAIHFIVKNKKLS